MIRNKTSKKVLARNLKHCHSAWAKGLGCMFTFSMKHALIFHFKKQAYADLHMFFVFHPIDVLWLDGKKRVVDLEKKLLPFTYRSARCKSKFVLEFEPGTIQKTRTKLGDLIYFANNA
nr:hypothetical protein [uncultured archaeon]